MARTWKIRLSEMDRANLEALIGYDADPALLVGQRAYITEAHREGSGARSYKLHLSVPRTNRGVERAAGWLGTTNNIYAEAHGAWEVTGRSRTHLHLRAVEEEPARFAPNEAVAAHARFVRAVDAAMEAERAARYAREDAEMREWERETMGGVA